MYIAGNTYNTYHIHPVLNFDLPMLWGNILKEQSTTFEAFTSFIIYLGTKITRHTKIKCMRKSVTKHDITWHVYDACKQQSLHAFINNALIIGFLLIILMHFS